MQTTQETTTTTTTTTTTKKPPNRLKTIYDRLHQDMQFDYGSKIPVEELLFAFGIELLTEEEAQELNLFEIKKRLEKDTFASLQVFDLISRSLLAEGKHFSKKLDHYCVALPSENERLAINLMEAAQRRIRKATKLLRYTPREYKTNNNSIANKLLMSTPKKIH